MLRRITEWCVPDDAFWSWREARAVWWEKHWITLDPRTRFRYMAIYGVLPR